MWQFVTVAPPDDGAPAHSPRRLSESLRAGLPVRINRPEHAGVVTHALTHRRYHFDVFVCGARHHDEPPAPPPPRVWTTLEGLSQYPLPRPHVTIAEMLAKM